MGLRKFYIKALKLIDTEETGEYVDGEHTSPATQSTDITFCHVPRAQTSESMVMWSEMSFE